MTAKRKPKKAALVLTDDDRAVLSSLPDDKRATVEDIMRRHAGLTAAEALQALPEVGTPGPAAAPVAGRTNNGHCEYCKVCSLTAAQDDAKSLP